MATNSFSGGEIRSGSAVWNQDPLPPKPTYTLICQSSQGVPNFPNSPGGRPVVQAHASTLDSILEFELQLRAIGYEFISLERKDT